MATQSDKQPAGAINERPSSPVQKQRVSGAGRIRRRELASFTRRLAAMLDAGLPLIQCLEALAEQALSKEFKRVILSLRARVEAGDSFFEALRRFESLFGDLYVNMVRAGEFGGSLAEVTDRLASYLEAAAALRRRVMAAMMYPGIILILACCLTTALLIFIVPAFESIYSDFGAELPGPTKALMLISRVIRHQAPLVIAIVVVLAIVLYRLKKTEAGGLFFHRIILRFPLLGKLFEKIALARLSRTFASLLRSGVPILRTVEIAASATGNTYIGKALASCGPEIEGGSNIADSMRRTSVFPPMIIHMIAVGEKTGNIDGMLEKIADFYEDEVAIALEGLSSTIEPILMVILGIMIGSIVISIFMPIFSMHQLINK